MGRVAISLFCLSLLISSGCGGNDPSGPYEGAWTLTVTGTSSGTATMQVLQLPNIIHTDVTLTGNPSGTFDFQMTVDSTGTLTGTIYAFLVSVGQIDGSLAGNPGSGTYSLLGGTGTWTAPRK